MANFQHPPIDMNIMRNVSLQEDFAEKAYEILSTYQIENAVIVGDQEVVYTVTDRIDTVSLDPEVETALRLVRKPVYSCSQNDYPELTAGSSVMTREPSTDYLVIELQYGLLNPEEHDEEEFIVDEDYAWQPYVVSVTSREGEVDILDAKTGEELSAGDLLHAGYIMELLHQELRGIVYESALDLDDMAVKYTPLATHYEPFPEDEELDLNYTCHLCGRVNTPCGCMNSQMN